ncbi:dicer-like protein 4 isoform X1 [Primulina eburnea]|uniref:dicer-like protein 4 isoform X1 n=1 Tax=Primulina eburnea TaxID=1245227 RepID=UPI003C6C12EA
MDGGCSSSLPISQRVADGISDQLSSLSLEGDDEHRHIKESEKDPRTIARKYQIDLCMKAMEENVTIYLGTGCGKTHIAVLLIYEMGHLIKKPQKSVCIFLAPTVALVQQWLGDVAESCAGALFLDAGFDLNRIRKIVMSLLDPIVTLSKLQFNPLRDLRELCQYHKCDIQFSSVEKDDKLSVEAKVDAKNVAATACATNVSGKMAKKIAARQVFECLKAQGYRTKSKSLEEVLRKCGKREAKLIGYDETSSLESVKSGKLKIQESPRSDCDVKLYPLSEASTSKCDIVTRPLRQTSYRHTASESHVTQTIHNNGCNVESPASHLNNESELDPQGAGSICIGTAKLRLYEMCAANCWKPPIFECCDETGPSHFKQFIYKIMLDIEEMPEETFEFYGKPRTRKKDAAENAAQGAIWFLKCQGYL